MPVFVKAVRCSKFKNALHAGTDINAKNEFGRTALTWAARDNTNPEVLKLLLDAGADIRATRRAGRL